MWTLEMNNKVIFPGIEQLITIFARAESQYCHPSLPEVKALEVSAGLLASNLPENLVNLLWMHVCKIEAWLLSMDYLLALFEKRY